MRTLFLSGQGRAMGSAGAQLIPLYFQLPLKSCLLFPFRRVLRKCFAAIAPTCLLRVHYYLHGNVSKDMEALNAPIGKGYLTDLTTLTTYHVLITRLKNIRHCCLFFLLLTHAAANYQV